MVFTDPEKVCTFIDEFNKLCSPDTVTVYLTESATNKEEQAFGELGVKVSLLH